MKHEYYDQSAAAELETGEDFNAGQPVFKQLPDECREPENIWIPACAGKVES